MLCCLLHKFKDECVTLRCWNWLMALCIKKEKEQKLRWNFNRPPSSFVLYKFILMHASLKWWFYLDPNILNCIGILHNLWVRFLGDHYIMVSYIGHVPRNWCCDTYLPYSCDQDMETIKIPPLETRFSLIFLFFNLHF